MVLEFQKGSDIKLTKIPFWSKATFKFHPKRLDCFNIFGCPGRVAADVRASVDVAFG